jgi:hypothetical protein
MHAAHLAAGLAIKGHASKAPGPGVDDRGLHARIKVDHLIILGVVGIEPSPVPAFSADCSRWLQRYCGQTGSDSPFGEAAWQNIFPVGLAVVSQFLLDRPIYRYIPRAWRSIAPSFYRSIALSSFQLSSGFV